MPDKYHPYPRSLYRADANVGPDNEFGGVRCAMRTVQDEKEEAAAAADGWRDSPATAALAGATPAMPRKAARSTKRKAG